jgi:sulfite exporter TauE/SafE
MKALLSLFVLGLSFGFGPCLTSCGPILLPYFAGNRKDIRQSFLGYLVFSISRIFVYLILGILIFSLGSFFAQRILGELARIFFAIGGAFIVLLGLLTAFGFRLERGFCQALHRNLLQRDVKSIVALGLIVGLLPCAPLIALFSYIGLMAGSLGKSILYSLIFGLGTFLSPLLILSLIAGFIPRLIKGQEIYNRVFSIICGLIIVYLGTGFLNRAIR